VILHRWCSWSPVLFISCSALDCWYIYLFRVDSTCVMCSTCCNGGVLLDTWMHPTRFGCGNFTPVRSHRLHIVREWTCLMKYASSSFCFILDACNAAPLVSAGRRYRSWLLIRGMGMLMWHSSPVWRFHSVLLRTILSHGKPRIRQLRKRRRSCGLRNFKSQSLSKQQQRDLGGGKRLHCVVYVSRISPIWIVVLHLC
jgi:hypothetical protein